MMIYLFTFPHCDHGKMLHESTPPHFPRDVTFVPLREFPYITSSHIANTFTRILVVTNVLLEVRILCLFTLARGEGKRR